MYWKDKFGCYSLGVQNSTESKLEFSRASRFNSYYIHHMIILNNTLSVGVLKRFLSQPLEICRILTKAMKKITVPIPIVVDKRCASDTSQPDVYSNKSISDSEIEGKIQSNFHSFNIYIILSLSSSFQPLNSTI